MPSLIGYRKLIVAVLFWASATALCAFDKLDGGGFVAVAGLVTGLFGVTNAAVSYTQRRVTTKNAGE